MKQFLIFSSLLFLAACTGPSDADMRGAIRRHYELSPDLKVKVDTIIITQSERTEDELRSVDAITKFHTPDQVSMTDTMKFTISKTDDGWRVLTAVSPNNKPVKVYENVGH